MLDHRSGEQCARRILGARRLRAALLAVTLALLGACAPAPREERCDLLAESQIAFTAPDASDRVTVRTFAPSCGEAIALYAVTTADGEAIWAWSAIVQRTFGEALRGADADEMGAFLQRWSAARVERTSAAPAWPLGGETSTTLDRATYEDIRARDLPMLCHLSSVARETCVFWEPAAGGAGHFYDRDATGQTGFVDETAPQGPDDADTALPMRSEEN